MSEEQQGTAEPGGDADPVEQSFRDTLYTVDKQGRRRWVYPSLVKGAIFHKRRIVAYCLMAVYLSMPWLKVGGEQAVFLDLMQRRFTFFGVTYWATDTIFLLFVLTGLALSLFLFTALFGRVWCGWACPETVFLEFLFRPIERLVEGTASQRARLDRSPWTLEKICKKLLKHALCAYFAWVLASTFLAYFIGSEILITMMKGSPLDNPVPFFLTLIMMGVMAFQFGWFREQFCTVLCPYARFQSALMDDNSIVVGYDVARGEPRGKVRKARGGCGSQEVSSDEKGDCIDCGLCVRVCPTGIDIRNGLQLECVACTSCIDACNSIMDKVERPRGLIRYTTENALSGKDTRILRPRVFLYLCLAALYCGLFAYALFTRAETDITILRGAVDSPFERLSGDLIVNHLHLKISNKSKEEKKYAFAILDAEEISLKVPLNPFPVAAGGIQTVPLFVQFPQSVLEGGKRKIRIEIRDDPEFRKVETFTLLGPNE